MEGVLVVVVIGLIAVVVILAARMIGKGSVSSDSPFDSRGFAAQLGAGVHAPARPDEVAVFTGSTPDNINWTTRVFHAVDTDSESVGDYHHFLWFTDAVHSKSLLLVLGDDPSGAKLDEWLVHPGRTPEEMEDLHQQADDIADQLSPLLKDAKRNPVEAMARLESVMQERHPQGMSPDAMQVFVAAAHPVELGPDLASTYHAFTIDDILASKLLSPPVPALLQAWAERYRHHIGSIPVSLRVWVGDTNLRIEAHGANLPLEAYRLIVDLGAAMARSYHGSQHGGIVDGS